MAKKSGLGKGLNALISESGAEATQGNTTELPITKIVVNKEQPRKSMDKTELASLSDSIAQHGVLQPILVRKKGAKYEIVAGERRFTAAKKAGLKSVPVVIKEIDDNQASQLALIENIQRADLSALEEAQAYKKLIEEQGLTQGALAKTLSKSRAAIANTLRLLDLPQEVQKMLADGSLSAGHARAILVVSDPAQRVALATKIVADKLSVREAERLAPLYAKGQSAANRRRPTPASFKQAATYLRKTLGVPVRVKTVRGKNKIDIEFADENELMRLIEVMAAGLDGGLYE